MNDDPCVHWFTTGAHPFGVIDQPCFECLGSMVYASIGHPAGRSSAPWYQVRDHLAYPVDGHPEGPSRAPSYLVADDHVYPVPPSDERAPWFRVGRLRD